MARMPRRGTDSNPISVIATVYLLPTISPRSRITILHKRLQITAQIQTIRNNLRPPLLLLRTHNALFRGLCAERVRSLSSLGVLLACGRFFGQGTGRESGGGGGGSGRGGGFVVDCCEGRGGAWRV